MEFIKKWIVKYQSKRMWKEIKERQEQILQDNYNKTFIMCMCYIQRQELASTGLLPTLKEQTIRATEFYNNLKYMGLIDSSNKPLESIVGTLKGLD